MRLILLNILIAGSFQLTAQGSDSVFIQFHTYPKDSFSIYSTDGMYVLHPGSGQPKQLENYRYVDPVASIPRNGKMEILSCSDYLIDAPQSHFPLYIKLPVSCDSLMADLCRRDEFRQSVAYQMGTAVLWDSQFTPMLEKYGYTVDHTEPKPEQPDTASNTAILGGPSEGIIDGVIVRACYQYKPIATANLGPVKATQREYALFREQILTPRVQTLLESFYLSKYEVTNGQYQEFVKWALDSIALEQLYWNLEDKEALVLLNCTKSERKQLDPSERAENRRRYGLRIPEKKRGDFYNNPAYVPDLSSLYAPQNQRFYQRRTFKESSFRYRINDSTEVLLLTDSTNMRYITGWLDPYVSMYYWHPAYDNYPILNLTYEQAQAYCQWLTTRYRESSEWEGWDVEVRLPEVRHYELALKAEPDIAPFAISDRPNTSFIQTRYSKLPDWMYTSRLARVNSPAQLNVDKSDLSIDFERLFYEYDQWYHGSRTGELHFINGNASEWCSTPITASLLEEYDISAPDDDLSNFAFKLGSNYFQDVKVLDGSPANTIFYKRLDLKNCPDELTGFRTMLIVRQK